MIYELLVAPIRLLATLLQLIASPGTVAVCLLKGDTARQAVMEVVGNIRETWGAKR